MMRIKRYPTNHIESVDAEYMIQQYDNVSTLLVSMRLPGAVQKHHTKGCGPTGTLPPYCDGGTGDAWGVPLGKPEPLLQSKYIFVVSPFGWLVLQSSA